MSVKVLDEVGLALELPRELLRVHLAEGPLLRVSGLSTLHVKCVWKV